MKDGTPYLYGTTSYGVPEECNDPDGLGFYANIDDKNVLNWIVNFTKLTGSQLTNKSSRRFSGMNDFFSYC